MTRWPRVCVGLAILVFAAVVGGCAFPVSMPMAPLAGLAGDGKSASIVTAAAGPAVEEVGVSDRLGAEVWTALQPAVATAIDRGEDGEPFAWRSGSGDRSGTVTPVAAYFGEGGAVCRRLAITVAHSGAGEELLAEACRGDGDAWRVTPLASQA